MGETLTGELRMEEERKHHINWLELQGGVFAVRTFAKDKSNIHVRLRMDNTTAIAYINRLGGTRSQALAHSAYQLWQWCLHRGITLSAEHLPGTSNCTADGVSHLPLISKMETAHCSLHSDLSTIGTLQCGPLRKQAQQPAASVYQLASKPLCSGNGCLSDIMAGYPWVRFSSLLPCRKLSPEDSLGRSNFGDGGADPAMVSNATRESGRLSDTADDSSRHVESHSTTGTP